MTGTPTSSRKIVVVDDDDEFRHGLVRTLEAAGYETAEAADADEARSRLAGDDGIGLMLCDVRMPGVSGIDLLREVVQDIPDLAVVMVTGIDEPEMAQLAFDIGAYGYLAKPFERNELLISVANALSRQDLEVAKRRHTENLERTIERMRTLQDMLNDLDAAPGGNGESIERLSRALTLRDEETGRHIERMSRYAALIAEAAGPRDATPEEVRLMTALHDVGKIGIADTILLKPGSLTAVEYVAMQRHAQIGYQLLAGASSSLMSGAADVALSHHEWWNGGGYPRGLEGDEIPEEARIAAVTDVFDALTSDRVYRPGLEVDEAISIMRESRGRQFEPRLFDAFIDVLPDVLDIREQFPDRGEEDRIRVLIVDDHEIFVESLTRLLGAASDIKVVGRAGTVADGVKAADAYAPDVVLMDFELPDDSGPSATRQIKSLTPRSKVVMLTGRDDPAAFTQAIDAGCAGFVTKTQSSDIVLDAIRAAHQGEVISPTTDLLPLLEQLRPTQRGMGAALGRRELEVLQLAALGLSNRDIAERLSLSLNTVRNHVQGVLYKLNAHSKLEAVATGVREGILEFPIGQPAS